MESKKKRAAAEWKEGTVQELFHLTDAEALIIEMKVALEVALRERMERESLTQSALARRMGTSQPRIAHMLKGREVSIEQLITALLAAGATGSDVARTLAPAMKSMTSEPRLASPAKRPPAAPRTRTSRTVVKRRKTTAA